MSNFAIHVQQGVEVMIQKIDHIGIAVHSLEEALPFYTNVLKLRLLGVEEVASQQVKVAFLELGESKLELLEPLSKESPIAMFIQKRGEGIHHVALGVKSIADRIQEMEQNGIQMIDSSPRIGAAGASIAFMHPKSAHGVLYELCEKKGVETHG
jgi:methylmalonyl-CoA/ethylmalonyl-CoA epimerase